jgi:hypothetical protein
MYRPFSDRGLPEGDTSTNEDYTTAPDSVDSDRHQIDGGSLLPEDSRIPFEDREAIIQCVHDLKFKDKRENALLELSKKREWLQDLAPVIWHSIGTISALLQEIISVYPYLNPSTMNSTLSNRACNVLALLQCVAAHPETRSAFIKANIPLFLYPFLNTVSKGRAYEYLRLTSLGVIGALVKVDNPEFINFLLHTEIIPLSLRIMERGTELSQTVATFIIQKILTDSTGLNYICQTKQRFFTVITVMDTMVKNQKQQPSQRLLKHIARWYQKLFDNPKAKEHLTEHVPSILTDVSIEKNFDENTKSIIISLKDQVQKCKDELASRGAMNNPHMRMMMNPHATMGGMVSGMENPMNKAAGGRASAEIRQPMFSRPNSTSYHSNNQMYRGTPRTFVPSQTHQPFPRPGSSQPYIPPMHSNIMGNPIMQAQSPPIQHASNQPVMMQQYINPIPMSQSPMNDPNDARVQQMMRMGHNQSPYDQPMPAQQPQYPSGMTSPGMMQNPNMYMHSNMNAYRPVPQRNINQPGTEDNSNM